MTEQMFYKGLALDGFQKEAIQAVSLGENVIVAAPTGSGKTLIAEYAIEKCIAEGKRIIYTSPIKALSNQKFRDFTQNYGDLIGIMTGDVTINSDAQVLIMTTEVFRNTIFENPERLEHMWYVIFDEIHYMDDLERGTVWEESIIFAPSHIRFLALSATIQNLNEFASWIEYIRESKVRVVLEETRPVPLRHYLYLEGEELIELEELEKNKKIFFKKKKKKRSKKKGDKEKRTPFIQTQMSLIDKVMENRHLPAIYFMFSRAACERMADRMKEENLLSTEESKRMEQILQQNIQELAFTEEEIQHGKHIIQLLRKGVCFHHAGILPVLKELIERCFSTGLLKLLFATETFALGVNMPAKAVIFDSLRKFNGIREVYIKARDYQQMAGRAGRRGIDQEGYVYSILQPHRESYRHVKQVLTGKAEPVSSRFNLDYCTLLNLYHRLGDNFFEAWEKSFASFKTKQQKRKPYWYQNMIYQVEAKLEVLNRTKYIQDENLTEKGFFAMKISGYEIHISELYFHGLLSQLDPIQLNALFSAIVFEGRREIHGKRFQFSLSSKMRKKAKHVLGVFFRIERSLGILNPIKELDFGMSYATDLWSQGYSLTEIEDRVEFSPGDVIRNLRRTLQILRQLEKALEREEKGDFILLEKVKEGISLLKRDMVDAEAQLKRGLPSPDQSAIAAALKKAGFLD
ncbi:MAG: DEAD/DEAH box helicase [Planctomycetota bacterium]|nr:MAG: DEAD/DEAH box helicase [Planctomycetota bacterium]